VAGWRDEIALLYAGRPRHAVTRALSEAVELYGLTCADFLSVIEGMEMDARTDICAPPQWSISISIASGWPWLSGGSRFEFSGRIRRRVIASPRNSAARCS